MKRYKYIGLTLLFAWIWVSCTDHTIYHAYHHPPREGWKRGDTLSLHVQITDSLQVNAELLFLLRNQSNYPFQDFNAILQHNLPDTTIWRTYKLNFILSDKDGRWYGSGWGGLYQSSVSLGNAHILHPGTYTMKIIHQMDAEYLKGIHDVGILVRKEAIAKP